MKFYFAWSTENEEFSPQKHGRCDEKILRFSLFEEEGTVPHVRLTIPHSRGRLFPGAPQKQNAFIALEVKGVTHLLFRGKLVGFADSLQGEVITLTFLAHASQDSSSYRTLLTTLEQDPTWDPLFLPEEKRSRPPIEDLLEAKPAFLYFNRSSPEVSLSDLFEGNQEDKVGGRFYRDSLRLKVTHAPLEEIEVEISTRWVQRFQGSTRLDSLLQAALPEGLLYSYSGESLQKKWWKTEKLLGASGYHILESSLDPVPLKNFPKASVFLSPEDPWLLAKGLTGKSSEGKVRRVYLQKKAFRPRLKVGWRYIQPRKETVAFTVKNDFQPLLSPALKKKRLYFTLYNLVDLDRWGEWAPNVYYKRGERVTSQETLYRALRSHRSGDSFEKDAGEWERVSSEKDSPLLQNLGTFFLTDRGRKSLHRALEIAKTYLAASTRCIEISFCCPMEQALSWTCDHTLILEDERLPGGKVRGKVKRLTYEMRGETGQNHAYVTLAFSIGKGLQSLSVPSLDLEAEKYGEEGLLEEGCVGIPLFHQLGPDLFYEDYQGQSPDQGVTYPALLGAGDILREVAISYDAARQEEKFKDLARAPSSNIVRDLKPFQTRLQLRLEDLKSCRVLEHKIHLKIPHPWSAPRQITLG